MYCYPKWYSRDTVSTWSKALRTLLLTSFQRKEVHFFFFWERTYSTFVLSVRRKMTVTHIFYVCWPPFHLVTFLRTKSCLLQSQNRCPLPLKVSFFCSTFSVWISKQAFIFTLMCTVWNNNTYFIFCKLLPPRAFFSDIGTVSIFAWSFAFDGFSYCFYI